MGNLSSGISSLTTLYKTRPDAVSARIWGWRICKAGNRAEARSYLLRAAGVSNAHDAATYNYLGLLEPTKGNLEQASHAFGKLRTWTAEVGGSALQLRSGPIQAGPPMRRRLLISRPSQGSTPSESGGLSEISNRSA